VFLPELLFYFSLSTPPPSPPPPKKIQTVQLNGLLFENSTVVWDFLETFPGNFGTI